MIFLGFFIHLFFLGWPFQSTTYPIKHQPTFTHPEIKPKKSPKLDSIVSKKDALTFHLHTHHHHHHIHKSKSSSLIKTIQPLGVHNALTPDDQPMSPSIENEVLNLSINNKVNTNGIITKKTTRRKSSPVKRCIITRTKSNG
jgi:hypothetical protein